MKEAGSRGSAEGLNALAIDTTSDCLSLAVMRAGSPVAAQYEALGRRTAQEILPRLHALLHEADLEPRALEVLLVARGPGSFTGTRIGMAVAQTFAQVLNRPLLGVDTLTLLAAQADPAGGEAFHVLLNCTRDEVYHARFGWAGGRPRMTGEIILTTAGALSGEIGQAPVVLRRFAPRGPAPRPGNGNSPADPHAAAFAAFRPMALKHARPDGLLLLEQGLAAYRARPGGPWPVPEPLYLKSEAFRKWQGSP